MTFSSFSIVGMCPHTIWTPGSDLLREDRGCCISSNLPFSGLTGQGTSYLGCGKCTALNGVSGRTISKLNEHEEGTVRIDYVVTESDVKRGIADVQVLWKAELSDTGHPTISCSVETASDYSSAVLFFQRAVLLDPNFAMAYASLGRNYYYLGETGLAADYTKKAYGLRDRTSERERFYIVSHYHHFVTGDLERARNECELWLQTYPRDPVPHDNLGDIFTNLGLYEKALAEYIEHHNLAPESALSYLNLVFAYLALNRFDEALEPHAEESTHQRSRFSHSSFQFVLLGVRTEQLQNNG